MTKKSNSVLGGRPSTTTSMISTGPAGVIVTRPVAFGRHALAPPETTMSKVTEPSFAVARSGLRTNNRFHYSIDERVRTSALLNPSGFWRMTRPERYPVPAKTGFADRHLLDRPLAKKAHPLVGVLQNVQISCPEEVRDPILRHSEQPRADLLDFDQPVGLNEFIELVLQNVFDGAFVGHPLSDEVSQTVSLPFNCDGDVLVRGHLLHCRLGGHHLCRRFRVADILRQEFAFQLARRV